MQVKFLKQIVEHVAGNSAIPIIDLLSDKKDVNEFIIAKKLGITINQTRNILYRLSHLGVIFSMRKKDKRKGWYIYFWTLNVLRSLELLEEILDNKISELEEKLKDKQLKRFYKCKLCGKELTEEHALLTNFSCSECGEIYELADHTHYMQSLIKEIQKLKKERDLIKKEREKEQCNKQSKLKRVIRKVEKDKKKKRASARAKKQKDKKIESLKKQKSKNKKYKGQKAKIRKKKK